MSIRNTKILGLSLYYRLKVDRWQSIFEQNHEVIFIYIILATKYCNIYFFFQLFGCPKARQVSISNLSAFFPRRVWLLIIVFAGILFQNHEIPTSQTWTCIFPSTILPLYGKIRIRFCPYMEKHGSEKPRISVYFTQWLGRNDSILLDWLHYFKV